jgi:hypothetical protein
MRLLVNLSIAALLAALPAWADSLQVIKTFPGQPQILVDQGADSGLVTGKRVDLVLKSGRRIATKVKKSNGTRAVLEIPQVYQDRFKVSAAFSFEVAEGGEADRRTASMMEYSSASSYGSSSRNPKAVKALAGMASAGMASSILVFGADYVIPVARSITLSPGVTYWSTSSGVEVGDSWSFLTADVAGGFHIPVQKKVDLELGGRLGLRRSAVNYPAVGALAEENYSSFGMLLTPYSSVDYAFSKSGSAGAEVRLPLSGSSDIGMNMFYGMGFVKFRL